jgi:hypothetical protein
MATVTAANGAAQRQNLPIPHPDMAFLSVLIAAISCLPYLTVQIPDIRMIVGCHFVASSSRSICLFEHFLFAKPEPFAGYALGPCLSPGGFTICWRFACWRLRHGRS